MVDNLLCYSIYLNGLYRITSLQCFCLFILIQATRIYNSSEKINARQKRITHQVFVQPHSLQSHQDITIRKININNPWQKCESTHTQKQLNCSSNNELKSQRHRRITFILQWLHGTPTVSWQGYWEVCRLIIDSVKQAGGFKALGKKHICYMKTWNNKEMCLIVAKEGK